MHQIKSLERLSLILNLLRRGSYPSMQEMIYYLENKEMFPTERTMQRDLKTLRDLCRIEVKYDRFRNGYFLDEQDKLEMDEWMQVFELFNTSKAINETLLKSSSTIDYIDFDRTRTLMDLDVFKEILEAIISRHKIQFNHHGFWEDVEENVVLEPHLLKQFENRWYVFGSMPNGEFRRFGMERIKEFQTLAATFKPLKKSPKELFDHVIGLEYEDEVVEEVMLVYQPNQGKYIKTQPLHPSQKILVDTNEELRISIRVIPNYELHQQILKHAERVQVIAPLWLRERIKERIRLSLARYDEV